MLSPSSSVCVQNSNTIRMMICSPERLYTYYILHTLPLVGPSLDKISLSQTQTSVQEQCLGERHISMSSIGPGNVVSGHISVPRSCVEPPVAKDRFMLMGKRLEPFGAQESSTESMSSMAARKCHKIRHKSRTKQNVLQDTNVNVSMRRQPHDSVATASIASKSRTAKYTSTLDVKTIYSPKQQKQMRQQRVHSLCFEQNLYPRHHHQEVNTEASGGESLAEFRQMKQILQQQQELHQQQLDKENIKYQQQQEQLRHLQHQQRQARAEQRQRQKAKYQHPLVSMLGGLSGQPANDIDINGYAKISGACTKAAHEWIDPSFCSTVQLANVNADSNMNASAYVGTHMRPNMHLNLPLKPNDNENDGGDENEVTVISERRSFINSTGRHRRGLRRKVASKQRSGANGDTKKNEQNKKEGDRGKTNGGNHGDTYRTDTNNASRHHKHQKKTNDRGVATDTDNTKSQGDEQRMTHGSAGNNYGNNSSIYARAAPDSWNSKAGAGAETNGDIIDDSYSGDDSTRPEQGKLKLRLNDGDGNNAEDKFHYRGGGAPIESGNEHLYGRRKSHDSKSVRDSSSTVYRCSNDQTSGYDDDDAYASENRVGEPVLSSAPVYLHRRVRRNSLPSFRFNNDNKNISSGHRHITSTHAHSSTSIETPTSTNFETCPDSGAHQDEDAMHANLFPYRTSSLLRRRSSDAARPPHALQKVAHIRDQHIKGKGHGQSRGTRRRASMKGGRSSSHRDCGNRNTEDNCKSYEPGDGECDRDNKKKEYLLRDTYHDPLSFHNGGFLRNANFRIHKGSAQHKEGSGDGVGMCKALTSDNDHSNGENMINNEYRSGAGAGNSAVRRNSYNAHTPYIKPWGFGVDKSKGIQRVKNEQVQEVTHYSEREKTYAEVDVGMIFHHARKEEKKEKRRMRRNSMIARERKEKELMRKAARAASKREKDQLRRLMDERESNNNSKGTDDDDEKDGGQTEASAVEFELKVLPRPPSPRFAFPPKPFLFGRGACKYANERHSKQRGRRGSNIQVGGASGSDATDGDSSRQSMSSFVSTAQSPAPSARTHRIHDHHLMDSSRNSSNATGNSQRCDHADCWHCHGIHPPTLPPACPLHVSMDLKGPSMIYARRKSAPHVCVTPRLSLPSAAATSASSLSKMVVSDMFTPVKTRMPRERAGEECDEGDLDEAGKGGNRNNSGGGDDGNCAGDDKGDIGGAAPYRPRRNSMPSILSPYARAAAAERAREHSYRLSPTSAAAPLMQSFADAARHVAKKSASTICTSSSSSSSLSSPPSSSVSEAVSAVENEDGTDGRSWGNGETTKHKNNGDTVHEIASPVQILNHSKTNGKGNSHSVNGEKLVERPGSPFEMPIRSQLGHAFKERVLYARQ